MYACIDENKDINGLSEEKGISMDEKFTMEGFGTRERIEATSSRKKQERSKFIATRQFVKIVEMCEYEWNRIRWDLVWFEFEFEFLWFKPELFENF